MVREMVWMAKTVCMYLIFSRANLEGKIASVIRQEEPTIGDVRYREESLRELGRFVQDIQRITNFSTSLLPKFAAAIIPQD